MAPGLTRGRSGEIGVEIDESGAGNVSGIVRLPAAATVEIPPRVQDDDCVGIVLEPSCVDERSG